MIFRICSNMCNIHTIIVYYCNFYLHYMVHHKINTIVCKMFDIIIRHIFYVLQTMYHSATVLNSCDGLLKFHPTSLP